MINHKHKIKISARFWPIFDFELNEKRSRAEPSQAEKPSARAMARASLARTHHYYLSYRVDVIVKERSLSLALPA